MDSIPLGVYELTTKEKAKNEKRLKEALNDMFRKILKAEFPELYKRTVSAKLRNKILNRDYFKCQYCGIDLRENADYNLPPTVDHVNPVRSGGKDDPKNFVACCRRCNIGKLDFTEFEYKDRNIKLEKVSD